MSEDTYITVHRRDDINKDWVFHGKLTPQEAALETLAITFGGGTYRCQEKVRDESGAWRIGRTRTVKVAGPYRPPTTVLPGTKKEEAPPVSPAGAPRETGGAIADIMSAGVLQLFQAQNAQQQMMMQMFSAAQNNQAALLTALTKDRGASMDIPALIAAAAPVLQAFLARPSQERDPLEMLKAVGDIVRQNTGKQSDITDMVESLRAVMDLREMVAPGPAAGDPLMEAVPKIVEVLSEQHNMAKAKAAHAGMPVPGAAPVSLPAAGVPAQVSMPAWERLVKSQAARLLAEATAGRDPGFVAELAWEYAPAPVRGTLVEFLSRDDTTEQLLRLVPGLPDLWAAAFVKEARLVAGVTEEEEEEEEEEAPEADPSPEAGHAGHEG